MLKGNVDRGMVGIESKPEERLMRAGGGESGRTGSRSRSGKTTESPVSPRLSEVPELTHLGRGIDIFA
ncbi:MAG: hypothetical protein HY788_22100 [Deltaproteobacteria bacterium]|nr:hypothetical protein [Deltaproteobacteria bacterium]